MPTSPLSLNLLIKPVGSGCNLRCEYCYYLDKSDFSPGRPLTMSDELIERCICEFIAAQSGPCVRFDWHGGEPTLLGPDTLRKIIRWQKKYAGSRQIANSLQTNGTLLTHEWCNFFHENNFLIGISLDGPAHVHDRYRRDTLGRPTFERVMHGLDLLKTHNVEFNTLSVITDYSAAYPLEIFRFLKRVGSHYMQFAPAVDLLTEKALPAKPDTSSTGKLAPWSVAPLQYGNFLNTIFDEWLIADVGSYFVVTFDALLAKWCGLEPANCALADTCGKGPAMEIGGDVYLCDHYVFPDYCLGNIQQQSLHSLLLSDRLLRFGEQKSAGLPAVCRRCEYLNLCAGECPKHRTVQQGDGMLNHLCPGLQAFFRHTAPYMKYMKQQLESGGTPASVMEWARLRDSRPGQRKNLLQKHYGADILTWKQQ